MTAALRRFIGDYRKLYSPSHHQDRVLDWLCACQTSALGGRMAECLSKSECGWRTPVYNSCTDRHCPQCRGGKRAEWLAAREAQLLPVPHFQVTSTLPGALRQIARDNPRVVYGLLFVATAQTLQELAADRLNAQLGILAVLHTWASNLILHPHVHCLVTAGGLRLDQEAWVETRPNYLFPTSVMAEMICAKVVAGLSKAFAAGELFIGGEPDHAEVTFKAAIRQAYHHRWVVNVEPPDGRSAAMAAKYLARYVGGAAISDARMVAISSTDVTYKTRQGIMTVAGTEFVRRFVSHILPRRLDRVRYYGLYSSGNVHYRWAKARRLLNAPLPPPRPEPPAKTCPRCGGPVRETALPGIRSFRPQRPPRARGPP